MLFHKSEFRDNTLLLSGNSNHKTQRQEGCGSFCLGWVDFALDEAPLNLYREVIKVDVARLQPHQLANSQPKTGNGHYHGFAGFRQMRQ